MIIKSLFTNSFGKFKQNKWDDFSPEINVFYGKNEAGKSTIFQMIVHMMFGYKSKHLEKIQYKNDETHRVHIGGQLLTDHLIDLERKFDKKPSLTLVENQKETHFDNTALDAVSHIHRETYEEIYALDLASLTQFNESTWDDIEELLMNQYSGDTFNASSSVLKSIEEDMVKLKRQSERGNSLLKSLEEDRRQLLLEKKNMLIKAEQAEQMTYEAEVLEDQISIEKSRLVSLENHISNLEKYLPLINLLNEKDRIEKQLIAFEAYSDLSYHNYQNKRDTIKKLYLQSDELSLKISELVKEKRQLLDKLSIQPIEEQILKDAIENHLNAKRLKDELVELKKNIELKEKAFKKAFENTFDENVSEQSIDKIMNLNYMNIKALVQEIEGLHEEIKVLKRNNRIAGSGNFGLKIVFTCILFLAGLMVTYFQVHDYASYAGMFISGLSIAALIYLIIKNQNKKQSDEDLFEERDEIRTRLLKELSELKLSSIVEEFIGQEFLAQVLNLKQAAEDLNTLKVLGLEKEQRIFLAENNVIEFIKEKLGQVDHIPEQFDMLLNRLEENKKSKMRIDVINGQLDVLNESVLKQENELNSLETYLNKADEFLSSLGDGSIEQGFERLKSKDRLVLRNENILKELGGISYDEEILKRYKSLALDDQNDPNYLKTELKILNQKLNDHIVAYNNIIKDRDILLENFDSQETESKILANQEMIEETKTKYDRLLLMHHLVKSSDEKYRKLHQPAVYKIAGEYLSEITDGAYTNIDVVEDGKKKSIYVEKQGLKMKVDEKFSLGTLNQIFLSLRLALIDHLDDSETLPICFDELLVNWDHERLENTIKIIKMISKKRQVFIFTCHDWFVEKMKTIDVKVYEL